MCGVGFVRSSDSVCVSCRDADTSYGIPRGIGSSIHAPVRCAAHRSGRAECGVQRARARWFCALATTAHRQKTPVGAITYPVVPRSCAARAAALPSSGAKTAQRSCMIGSAAQAIRHRSSDRDAHRAPLTSPRGHSRCCARGETVDVTIS